MLSSPPAISCFTLLILLFSHAIARESQDAPTTDKDIKVGIGAIVDYTSRFGKEEKVAMEMAIDDFFKCTSQKAVIHIIDSGGDPGRASFAAKELINDKQVQAIVGLRTWEAAAAVAEQGNKAQIPILTLSDTVPSYAFQRWPFLIRAVRSQHLQMKAVAAIITTWKWRRVSVIYEDINSATTSIVPYLIDALHEVGSEIDQLLPLSSLSASFWEELGKLKRRQCRVFIVHISSLPLATRMFREAKEMGMLDKNSVWITTDGIAGILDSVNASVISSMQGVLGVQSYFPRSTSQFKDFYVRLRSRFRWEFPNETFIEPEIFSLQAYDAIWAVALGMVGSPTCNSINNQMDVLSGHRLLGRILLSVFEGLTGKFYFLEGTMAKANTFRIINVVGKSYRELGFWLDGSNFLENIDGGGKNSTSMSILGQVFWPGGPWFNPRGWAIPTSENPLRIVVPVKTTFDEFVNVRYDQPGSDPSVNGFAIEVFKASLKYLSYDIVYKFVTYGAFEKNADAVVADTAIIANRYQYAEFSQPYAESGLQIVFRARSKTPNKAWLFMKPFTLPMWAFTGAINIYNGFVVWLIERKDNKDLKEGSLYNQMGTLVWLAFVTLFSVQGERMHSNLSRVAMIVWLFVALIITQSYTASLSSMLTIHRLQTTEVTIESLKRNNDPVGCDGNSFVVDYLKVVLGFKEKNIVRIYSGDYYSEALESGEIAAAFLEAPYVKVLLAKYCNRFAVAKQSFKVGGFGFVFPKGSPLLSDISEAILKVSEKGELLELENALTSPYKCSDSDSDSDSGSLSPSSFWALFTITGGISTITLIVYLCRFVRDRRNVKLNEVAPEPEVELPGPVNQDDPLNEPGNPHPEQVAEAREDDQPVPDGAPEDDQPVPDGAPEINIHQENNFVSSGKQFTPPAPNASKTSKIAAKRAQKSSAVALNANTAKRLRQSCSQELPTEPESPRFKGLFKLNMANPFLPEQIDTTFESPDYKERFREYASRYGEETHLMLRSLIARNDALETRLRETNDRAESEAKEVAQRKKAAVEAQEKHKNIKQELHLKICEWGKERTQHESRVKEPEDEVAAIAQKATDAEGTLPGSPS
ncbi:hypothetical protein GIB67_030467 [Kingdonia uniflora]|uniref:Ionotropic glutamate receptor C-terminal domain-containing protein n=1 Tax=Kingdonia uniflora TaxID=39325 RepID=A0A7J7P740_9MAGN|nr:hypothetical protein GIB67_030467 [Kingdonia uniflora]